jgi:hypothetical protein
MAKVIIEVMTVGDQQSCQLPPDVPAPRRLAKDLALAAAKKFLSDKKSR